MGIVQFLAWGLIACLQSPGWVLFCRLLLNKELRCCADHSQDCWSAPMLHCGAVFNCMALGRLVSSTILWIVFTQLCMYSTVPVPVFEPDFGNKLKHCADANYQMFSRYFLFSLKKRTPTTQNQNTCNFGSQEKTYVFRRKIFQHC